MDIPLTPELEKKIQEKVSSGIYNSTSEVINEALHLLEARDSNRMRDFDLLKKDIEDGYKSGGWHEIDINEFLLKMNKKQ